MNLINNTVLITGGSSGIGFELAREMAAKGNQVIICGRSPENLRKAEKLIPGLITYQCDISVKEECEKLAEWIERFYPRCNMLVNNAAIVHKSDFFSDTDILSKADSEIRTNYFAPLMLTKLFLPILGRNANSAVIFVTSGLVYAPKAAYPVYCSTKAALHSFVQTLRIQFKSRNIKIIEVLMPAVDTPFHAGDPPRISIKADKAVKEMIAGLGKGKVEIKVAGTKIIYMVSRLFPSFAIRKINQF